MKPVTWALAVVFCISAAVPVVARAQTTPFYSLTDLKTLLVDRKEGFVFTNEGSAENGAGRSLKITALDTTSGVFAGVLTGSQFVTGVDTQGVYGTIHLGGTHGGTLTWLEFTYSISQVNGGIGQSQNFTAGLILSGVGTYSPSGFIAGVESEEGHSFTSGWSWKNQPFSGIMAVLP